MNVSIRDERPGDEAAIRNVTKDAFANAPYADGSEPLIPERLREAGALTLSIVAERDGEVVGHVAFSPVEIVTNSGVKHGWRGIGPLSVRPDAQRQGIGTALMHEGLRRTREAGAPGCVLIGDPNYYGRFGFAAREGLTYAEVPSAYVLALPFADVEPKGNILFHPAFGGS